MHPAEDEGIRTNRGVNGKSLTQSCKRVSTGPVLHFTLEQLIILTKGEVTNHLILPARMCGKTGVIRRFPDKEERSVLGCHMPLPPG